MTDPSSPIPTTTVLRGGLLVDGTGATPRRADVVLTGDRIAAVSEVGRAPTTGTVIDVDGAMITPGFIDLHSHADFTVTDAPAALTQLAQGVTTLLTGNCGFSPFPLDDEGRVRRDTAFLGEDLAWDWTDATGLAAAITAVRPAIDIGLQVGHGSIRTAVMGADDRPPTPDERRRMAAAITDAARAGVLGFSTGLIYPPGCFADTDELLELTGHAAAAGLILSTHMRDEAAGLFDAVGEAIELARRTGIGLEISHLKATGPAHHGMVPTALDMIDAAAGEGIDVQADVYPYTASATTLSARLPGWALDGGDQAMRARLLAPDTRQRIAADLDARAGRSYTPEGVVIATVPPGRYDWAAGLSVAEIAGRDGSTPTEVIMDVLAEHGTAVSMINHSMADADLEAALVHPRVSVASDGWVLRETGPGRPHPRSFGTFARVLGRYVRERGLLTWEQAVHKMSALPARRLRLADRGVIAPGTRADVVVLDPTTVADRSTYADPWQPATGVAHVWVGGVRALAEGRATDLRGGTVLRRPTGGPLSA